MRRALSAGLLALLVVSAGCLGATGGPGTATADPADDRTGGDASGDGTVASSVDGPAGTVNFYVSDRPNDMDDFEHLNVTVTSVQFHLVESADGANGTDADAGTETATAETDADDETATATVTATPTATATETATTDDDAESEGEAETEDEAEAESEQETDDESDEEATEGEGADGRWVTREVNATTVDLTRLRGDNATLVSEFALPAGEYDQVRLEISAVDGTLTTGESANVKLPSGRLKLNTEFTVADGSETDFVYDVSVHRAGNSGKYILKPVLGESGPDQPIEPVGPDGEREDEREDDESEDSLAAAFVGPVRAGENVTVRVTDDGDAVANATVTVNGETVGATDADGEYVVSVPDDAEELEIEVDHADGEAELEREFESGEAEDGDDTAETEDGAESTDDAPGNGDGQGSGNA